MAKIQLSALINSIKGRYGDTVYYVRKGNTFMKPYQPVVTQPGTARQTQTQTIFSDLVQAWKELSDDQSDSWSSYCSMLNVRMTAKNAFIKHNACLLMASHSGLTTIYSPPAFPSTPRFTIGLCAVALTSISTCISWIAPLTESDFVSVYFHLHTGFCLEFPDYGLCTGVGYRPHNRFIETVRSDVGEVVHTHDWPVDSWLYYKAFSLDPYGRRTPWTHKIKIIVPA